ncbi:type II toxin-antitoxin system RelE/ParE family toxin [Streptomyces sp. NPDC101234]|uniref:type II toxin-antitoxin system RelE family toxin n=1 Tax=Streptomyces sp. NPDC101234 TaxID=3366138 RepID=UPI003806C977
MRVRRVAPDPRWRTTRSWHSWRKRTAARPLRDPRGGVGTPRHERVPAAPGNRSRRCQGDCRSRSCACRRPRPESARALGTSGYYRLRIGTWRVPYRPDGDTVTVCVLKVGRST